MIYLHKILPLIISPLFISILCVLFYFFHKKKIYLYISLIITLLFSNSYISHLLSIYIEKPYEKISMNDIKISDYIVVLSGDKKRFDVGINLYKNGKAKKIVFTGGKLPWDEMKFNEGESYKIIARKLAIDEEDIIVTDIVQNTFQEAEKISLILPTLILDFLEKYEDFPY